ncbi:hypothetical protein RND81_01G190200 [Saponaria officinalis]|uniref:WRKY domain-containing protein n=1 Tax=Saponaria officinalis TaxID=3572 RepID=A0AAW1NJQ1_SAPOF
MKNSYNFDKKAQIINELLQGLEFAKQLQNQITTNKTTLLCDDDNHQTLNYSLLLLDNMMSTFDKTILIANQINNPSNHNNNQTHLKLLPQSLALVDSPRTENPSKRRKTMPKWTKTIQVDPDKMISGLEGPLNDGYSWRKYGQKEILGAKFPRNYYRCTHRTTKSCLATKQVQQSNNNPSIYQVMYKGEHTCYPSPSPNANQTQVRPVLAQIDKIEPQPQPSPPQHHPISQPIIQEISSGLSPQESLNIEPDDFADKAQIFRCFSFNTALLEAEPLDDYMLSYSPEFSSPTTSGSDYFPTFTYRSFGPHDGLNVQISEDDVTDPISGPDSVNNSRTIGDFEFPLDNWLDLDSTLFCV